MSEPFHRTNRIASPDDPSPSGPSSSSRLRPSTVQCPVCQVRFDPQYSAAMPFCSDRCRVIDLGRWLDEDYGMPLEPGEEGMDHFEG